jgi:hypothetical protein
MRGRVLLALVIGFASVVMARWTDASQALPRCCKFKSGCPAPCSSGATTSIETVPAGSQAYKGCWSSPLPADAGKTCSGSGTNVICGETRVYQLPNCPGGAPYQVVGGPVTEKQCTVPQDGDACN